MQRDNPSSRRRAAGSPSRSSESPVEEAAVIASETIASSTAPTNKHCRRPAAPKSSNRYTPFARWRTQFCAPSIRLWTRTQRGSAVAPQPMSRRGRHGPWQKSYQPPYTKSQLGHPVVVVFPQVRGTVITTTETSSSSRSISESAKRSKHPSADTQTPFHAPSSTHFTRGTKPDLVL